MGYFDNLVNKFEDNPELKTIFGQHIHWGYWENPSLANSSLTNFADAAENLSLKVIEISEVRDKLQILDCGCGFGGTINLLNQNFTNLDLRGINIDEAQILRAKQIIQPQNNNQIEFICADACNLPHFNSLFDLAIALECIFAFPSRETFFQQIRKNLKRGGKLIIVDFIIDEKINQLWQWSEKNILSKLVTDTYGSKANDQVEFITIKDYQEIASKTGFKLEKVININKNVQPTYQSINKLIINNWQDLITVKGLEYFSLLNLITYQILVFN